MYHETISRIAGRMVRQSDVQTYDMTSWINGLKPKLSMPNHRYIWRYFVSIMPHIWRGTVTSMSRLPRHCHDTRVTLPRHRLGVRKSRVIIELICLLLVWQFLWKDMFCLPRARFRHFLAQYSQYRPSEPYLFTTGKSLILKTHTMHFACIPGRILVVSD